MPRSPNVMEQRKFDLPQTWAEFKARVEDVGVRDSDRIFLIDIGPDADLIVLERDEIGVKIAGVLDDHITISAGCGSRSTSSSQTVPKNGRRTRSSKKC